MLTRSQSKAEEATSEQINLTPKNTNKPSTSTPVSSSNLSQDISFECDIDLDETIKPNLNSTEKADINKGSQDPIKPNNNNKKPEVTMSFGNEHVGLVQLALEQIPLYDGTNMKLSDFILACKEAARIIPTIAERIFVNSIRGKLSGQAREIIRTIDLPNLETLLTTLKGTFGTTYNSAQLYGELSRVYQKFNENVTSYGLRVTKLSGRILEAVKLENNGTAPATIKETLDKTTVRQFIHGLNKELEHRIPRGDDLNATIKNAIALERELKDIAGLRQEDGNTSKKTRDEDSFTLGTEILICQICKKRGHSADKCRHRDTKTRPVRTIQKETVKCQLCSKSGHSAKNCFKAKNTKSSVVCQYCDKPGHTANDCFKLKNNSNYQQKQSTFSKPQRDQQNSVSCRYCKEIGHDIADCRRRIASNNRYQQNQNPNNQGNGNSSLVDGAQQGILLSRCSVISFSN